MRVSFATIAMQGNFGKPRPALVMQSGLFDEHATVTVLPGPESRLQKPFQVMVDKAMTVRRNRLGQASGRVGADAMVEVERRLEVFLGAVK